jgi:hypothetical protein
MKKLYKFSAWTPSKTKNAPFVVSCINLIKQAPTTNSWIHVYKAAMLHLEKNYADI